MSKEESRKKRDVQVWEQLDEASDRVYYFGNGLATLIKGMEKNKEWLIERRNEDIDVATQLEEKIVSFMKMRHGIPDQVDERYENATNRLYEKLEWTPEKRRKNPGYAGYMDMTLRYQDVQKKLDRLTPMVKNSPMWLDDLVRDHALMSQMNEKLDELSYRVSLVDVSRTVSKRVIQDDPLTALFVLPSFFVGIIFHPTTSTAQASKLLRLCKRCLALSEAVQYERDSNNHPVVTMSGVLKNPPQKKSVPSLYEPIGSSEPADTTSSLIVLNNGEVSAPLDSNPPVAKDSSTTVGSKESLVPMSKSSEDERKNGYESK